FAGFLEDVFRARQRSRRGALGHLRLFGDVDDGGPARAQDRLSSGSIPCSWERYHAQAPCQHDKNRRKFPCSPRISGGWQRRPVAAAGGAVTRMLTRHSTVTDLARLRGWSTSVPMKTAV